MSKGRKEIENMIKNEKTSLISLMSQLPLNGNEFRVLMSILNDKEDYNSSQQEIADKTGVPFETVRKAYRSLKKLQYIIIERTGSQGQKALIKINKAVISAARQGQPGLNRPACSEDAGLNSPGTRAKQTASPVCLAPLTEESTEESTKREISLRTNIVKKAPTTTMDVGSQDQMVQDNHKRMLMLVDCDKKGLFD